MADAGSYPKLQRLGSEVPPNHANASKFYYHFLYKAVIVTIFLVILPLFSSQAPEFINQNLHNRSWELLQLIFVGIAVSYGLFSKRSEETEKEHSSKFDNAQSYVSRLLQVSSVFDDDAENPSAFDENKIQTWNSQYYRGEPVVVVAKDNSIREQRATSSQIGEKPLLLPVRSLKSRVSEPEILETKKESSSKAGSLSRSSSGSKRFSSNANKLRNGELGGVSPLNLEEEGEENAIRRPGSKRFSGNTNKSRNEEFGGLSPLNLELKVEESVVHRSPIPWRSRSGRMEMKEDLDGPPPYTISSSMENSESNRLQSRSFRSLSSKSSSVDSNSPSPNKLSLSPSLSSPKKLPPSPSWSLESQTKSIEDVVRKKSFHRSSLPPPPPPPPPPFLWKSTLMKSNSSVINDDVTPVKELRRSIRSVPVEFTNSEGVEPPRRANSGSELRTGAQSDGSFMAKSVRTIRPVEALTKVVKANEFGENDATFIEKREYTDKLMHEKLPTKSKRTFMEFPEEEKQEYLEKVLVETDDDTEAESEDDYFEEVPGKEEVSSSKEEAATDPVSDGGPDVDKKADEFIAKFREQIRLQRIESIRSSTREHVRNHSR